MVSETILARFAAEPGPPVAAALVRVARVASACRLTFPGSSAGARAAAAGYLVTLVETDPVVGATSPGVPGLAAELRSPVAPVVVPLESGSAGIAVVVARIVRGIFP